MAMPVADSSIRLEWKVCKDGYEIRPNDWNHWRREMDKDANADECIVPRSNRFETYNIGLLERGVYTDLINSARQPGAAGRARFRQGVGTAHAVAPPGAAGFH
jgi:hypothetical protein